VFYLWEETEMTKPNKRRFKLDEMRQQAAEALKTDPGYEIELEDGVVVFIPHPLFADDRVSEEVEKATNAVEIAAAVLGEEEHAKFLAAGGRSSDVSLAWALMQHESEDKLADGRPTR